MKNNVNIQKYDNFIFYITCGRAGGIHWYMVMPFKYHFKIIPSFSVWFREYWQSRTTNLLESFLISVGTDRPCILTDQVPVTQFEHMIFLIYNADSVYFLGIYPSYSSVLIFHNIPSLFSEMVNMKWLCVCITIHIIMYTRMIICKIGQSFEGQRDPNSILVHKNKK